MKKILACMLSIVMIGSLWVPATATPASESILSYYRGDINGDWAVNTSDVRALYASLSGERTALTSAATDADGDGITNMLDALTALRISAGLKQPCLVLPPIAEVDALPEGEAIPFENKSKERFNSYGVYDPVISTFYVAQSPEELRAICDHDLERRPDYAAMYDEGLFADKAVLVVRIDMGEWPEETVVSDVVRSGNTLTVKVRRLFHGWNIKPSLWRERIVLEIPKEALSGVDALQIRVSDEDINGGARWQ